MRAAGGVVAELRSKPSRSTRDADHRFAHRQSSLTCLASIGAGKRLDGYVYYAPEQVGPIAARTRQLQLQLLRAVGDALGDHGADKFRLMVPGINAVVLVALLRVGFRIDFANLLMASQPFGRFDRYVASGGTLL